MNVPEYNKVWSIMRGWLSTLFLLFSEIWKMRNTFPLDFLDNCIEGLEKGLSFESSQQPLCGVSVSRAVCEESGQLLSVSESMGIRKWLLGLSWNYSEGNCWWHQYSYFSSVFLLHFFLFHIHCILLMLSKCPL